MRYLFFIVVYFISILNLSAGKERIYIKDPSKDLGQKEAILILPGFGSRVHGTKLISDFFFNNEYDVFIPDYISRHSIADCVTNLDEFIIKHKLAGYKKLHVFSYIVGSWTLNKWILRHPKNNITSIVYDRSPLQERAPYALVKDVPFIIRLVAGKIMKEFSQTPYPSLTKNNIKVGIIIENRATKLVFKHKRSALLLGPITWDVDSLKQENDDFFYTLSNHDNMYNCFDVTGKEIMNFFSTGKFTITAKRQVYKEDPFTLYNKK
ncbi:MAG: hypothetical protein H0U95_09835 [Bacteroidetes bacterium]|nr:hypothetical protein [Bacteroidota bacterium]